MGICTSKKTLEKPQNEQVNNNNNDLVNSFQGSLSKQPQLKSSLVQTPIFHQNTGSLHQQSSGFIATTDHQIKGDFLKQFRIVQQNLDFSIVQQLESDKLFRAMILKKSQSDNEQLITRLISMPLKHKQILRLMDVYMDEINYYAIYEYEETKKLSEFLRFKNLSLEEAGIIFQQMLDIVKYIHELQYSHGALHIDVFSVIVNSASTVLIELTNTKSIYLKLPTKITQKNDIQALGLIVFQLIIGHQFRIHVSKSSKWEIKKELKDELSDYNKPQSVYKLISKMIDPIPLHRISINQAIQMCWYQNDQGQKNDNPNLKIIANNSGTLATVLICYIIEKFYSQDKQYLKSIFAKLDNNQSGKINFQQFLAVSEFKTIQQKNSTLKLYDLLSDDENKEITLSDFLILAIDPQKILNETTLQNAYMSLSNKNGYLTPKSLLKKIEVNEQELMDMFSETCDFDRLNYLEFKQLFQDILN